MEFVGDFGFWGFAKRRTKLVTAVIVVWQSFVIFSFIVLTTYGSFVYYSISAKSAVIVRLVAVLGRRTSLTARSSMKSLDPLLME